MVAQTILSQLGGGRFVAMTGAHSFTSDRNALIFKFPQRPSTRLFAAKITLTPADEYTVEFYAKAGRYDVRTAHIFEHVYCDQLSGLFESTTGLRVSL